MKFFFDTKLLIKVNPPVVNRSTKANDQYNTKLFCTVEANIVASQLKIFIPVGIAITIVAALKYALVSTSNPTVYICALVGFFLIILNYLHNKSLG